jgi:hypothetical protein
MPKAANKSEDLNNIAKELLIYTLVLFLLVLTSANLTNYLEGKNVDVLGAETQDEDTTFWNDFLAKNPSYIPGWIEIGKIDKVKEIDPNYIIP